MGIIGLVSKNYVNQERRLALSRVGGFYKKHPMMRVDVCFYCGLINPPELDHSPAVIWAYSLGPSWFFDRNVNLWLIPSCRECNSLLSDKPLHTAKQRKAFISSQLEARYQAALQLPKWDEHEIDELRGRLKTRIQRSEDMKRILVRRIAWAFTNDTMPGLSGDA